MQLTKKQFTLSMVLKGVAVAICVYGMSTTDIGVKMLTQFTNLSNLFAAIMVALSLVLDVLIQKGKFSAKTQTFYLFKFFSTVCILLTFFIYLCGIAPLWEGGFVAAYLHNYCGSLCVHFITPILFTADYFLFDHAYICKKRHCFCAILPVLLYFVFVVILGQAGVRWQGDIIAPYMFLNYAAPTGWFGFDLSQKGPTSLGIGVAYILIFISLIILGIAALLRVFTCLRQKALAKKESV